MSLLSYLTDYFQGSTGTYENQIVNIEEHFSKKFGVKIKTHTDLFLFKYDMVDAKWSYPLVQECRGHILRWDGTAWKYVSRPWSKFFNRHEGYCPFFEISVFEKNISQMCSVEKADGTAIQVFELNGMWHATTLGMIISGNVADMPNLMFDQLFWKTLGMNADQFASFGIPGYTHMFELCCTENRIVTKYAKNQTILLSIRHNETGEYKSTYEIDELIEKMACNVRAPSRTFFAYEELKTLADVEAWVEKNTADDAHSLYKEGFVIYNGAYPICKMKCNLYLHMHHVSGGDTGHTRNVIVESFFTGTIDDIENVLTDPMKEFLENLRHNYGRVVEIVIKGAETIRAGSYPSQKDYALAVKALPDPRFSGFYFSYKDEILGNGDLDQLTRDWIKVYWSKYLGVWKAGMSKPTQDNTEIPE